MTEPQPFWNAEGGAWLDLTDPGLAGGRFSFESIRSRGWAGDKDWEPLLGALAQLVLAAIPLVAPSRRLPSELRLLLQSHQPDILRLDLHSIEPAAVYRAGDAPESRLPVDDATMRRLAEAGFALALPAVRFGPGDLTAAFRTTQVRMSPPVVTARMSAHTRVALARWAQRSPLLAQASRDEGCR